jgi:GTP-binding protein
MSLKLAIVGRPNVGKSTLFNRLAGKKLAIVHDLPGVTRDRKEASGRLGDLELSLIDTAGFEDVSDESLEARMRAQTHAAIEDADVALFLIDARVGVTPLDERFADILRRAGKPVILGANKAEGRASESGVLEAYGLGLGEPVAISAEHGEGMGDLYAALAPFADALSALDDGVSDEAVTVEEAGLGDGAPLEGARPAPAANRKPIMLAVVGRPNAGKSTLINALIGADRLLTGPEAGITRDSIAVDFAWRDKAFRLVDTAGMRRKARVEGSLEHLSVADTIRAIRFAEVCALVMDETEAFEKQDLTIADLILREGRALIFVLAKWDQAEDPGARFKELKERALEALPQARGAPIVRVSAFTSYGLDAFMEAVSSAHTDWNARIKTPDLNRWMRHAIEKHPPPAVDGRRIKPKYIAQVKARPPTFVLISSRATEMPEHYRRYLINGIREAFDMPGVPIRLIVKAGKNPYADEN